MKSSAALSASRAFSMPSSAPPQLWQSGSSPPFLGSSPASAAGAPISPTASALMSSVVARLRTSSNLIPSLLSSLVRNEVGASALAAQRTIGETPRRGRPDAWPSSPPARDEQFRQPRSDEAEREVERRQPQRHASTIAISASGPATAAARPQTRA